LDGCAGTKVAVYGMAVNEMPHSGRRQCWSMPVTSPPGCPSRSPRGAAPPAGGCRWLAAGADRPVRSCTSAEGPASRHRPDRRISRVLW